MCAMKMETQTANGVLRVTCERVGFKTIGWILPLAFRLQDKCSIPVQPLSVPPGNLPVAGPLYFESTVTRGDSMSSLPLFKIIHSDYNLVMPNL